MRTCIALFISLLYASTCFSASPSPGERKGVACKFEKTGTTQIEQMVSSYRDRPGGPKGKIATCTTWRVTIATNRKSMVHYKVFNEANSIQFKMKGVVGVQSYERNRETWPGNPCVFIVGVWGKESPIIGAVAEPIAGRKRDPIPTSKKGRQSPARSAISVGWDGTWSGFVQRVNPSPTQKLKTILSISGNNVGFRTASGLVGLRGFISGNDQTKVFQWKDGPLDQQTILTRTSHNVLKIRSTSSANGREIGVTEGIFEKQ